MVIIVAEVYLMRCPVSKRFVQSFPVVKPYKSFYSVTDALVVLNIDLRIPD
jgi:hypothetical protein